MFTETTLGLDTKQSKVMDEKSAGKMFFVGVL